MHRNQFPTSLLAAFLFFACASPAMAGWVTLPNAPLAPLPWARHDDVFFVGPDSGWVVNGAGEIHRTTDGGASWELQMTLPNHLRSVGFADPLKGWVGTLDSPLLYATDNGGVTWTPALIPPPQPRGICGLAVVNASVVYGCGRFDEPATMIKTTDGGATWTSWDMGAYANTLIDCYFFDENTGFVVGGIGPSFEDRHAVILATNDGGATWETRHVTSRPGGEWCWKISFPTPTVGYASIERQQAGPSHVLKTTDGGQTWEEVLFIDDFDEQGIGFVTPSLGWVGGWGGPTYETTDGGATWNLASFGQVVNRVRFLSETLGYAVGQSVYKYTADVADVEAGLSAPAFTLAQNQPNPARGATRIPFTLRVEAGVKMAVYDGHGRRVATLLEGRRSPGRHEVTWDTRDDAGHPVGTGVYWYRLETARGAESKPLLVIR